MTLPFIIRLSCSCFFLCLADLTDLAAVRRALSTLIIHFSGWVFFYLIGRGFQTGLSQWGSPCFHNEIENEKTSYSTRDESGQRENEKGEKEVKIN